MKAYLGVKKFLEPKKQEEVRRFAIEVAKKEVDKQLEAAVTRQQYLWIAAMLNAGLSVKTVERCKNELISVSLKYGELKEEQCADFALCSDLKDAGVSGIEMPKGPEL